VDTTVESLIDTEQAGELVLKGIHRAVPTFNVIARCAGGRTVWRL
jgi:hypothetical protein